jgi:hypothetical protein
MPILTMYSKHCEFVKLMTPCEVVELTSNVSNLQA